MAVMSPKAADAEVILLPACYTTRYPPFSSLTGPQMQPLKTSDGAEVSPGSHDVRWSCDVTLFPAAWATSVREGTSGCPQGLPYYLYLAPTLAPYVAQTFAAPSYHNFSVSPVSLQSWVRIPSSNPSFVTFSFFTSVFIHRISASAIFISSPH